MSSSLLKKIGSNSLKKLPGGEVVELKSLWKDHTVVLYFLRRFGCPICQYISRQISKVNPLLKENDIKLVGIGPEDFGAKEFFEEKHFDGDLYVDTEKKCYRDIEYKRYNALSVLGAVISKKTRDLNNLASKEGLKGNMKGDLLQTGGLLIVKKGGEEILLNFKQESAADYVENQKILDSLGIKGKVATAEEMPSVS